MLRLLAATAFLVACKKTPTAESCGKLAVAIEGKPLPQLTHGLARKHHGGYEITMMNLDKTTCANILDANGRVIPDGEVSVKAFAGGDGMMSKGVVYDANTEIGDRVAATLIGDPPKAKGDPVRICVQDATIEIGFGSDRGKHVAITGLFEGTYCGE
jgi:hypothetical protein